VSHENDLESRLFELEARLEALERWKAAFVGADQSADAAAPARTPPAALVEKKAVEEKPADRTPVVAESIDAKPAPHAEPEVVQPSPIEFDLSLVGRLLIVLGGAFLLRAITESGVVSASIGVSLGLAYAMTWMVVGIRPSVSRTSAAYHGLAGVLAAYPLIFEATRKFHVLGSWSSALVLAIVSVFWAYLCWKRMLNGLAWVSTLGAIGTCVLLMAETSAMVPFVWYLTALGILTLWMGYKLKWHALRWPVAGFLDAVLLFMAFLVVTDRLKVEPAVAMAAGGGAFAAYLFSFVLRNLYRERSVVTFEVAQTIAALITALGGAVWIAAVKDTLELPIALAMLVIAAACYSASFVFIPRHFTSPRNFFFYSSLALILVLAGGAFITEGFASSFLWSALALTSAYFAGKYEKPVLAMHSAIYLIAGLVGAGLFQAGFRILALHPTGDWDVSWAGAMQIFAAAVIAAGIHPIERKGSFAIWSLAKLMILIVVTWAGATMTMALVGVVTQASESNAAMVAFERTLILSGLTVGAALVARFPVLSPGRRLATILMVVLAMKLIWDDLRTGTPLTMFLSFACVGVALIVATKLRKQAVEPAPA